MAPLALARQAIRSTLNPAGVIRILITLPLVIFLALELTNLGRAWLAVQEAARFGIRYAATGQFDPVYCAQAGAELGLAAEDSSDGVKDCELPSLGERSYEQEGLLQDRARLPSIRHIIQQSSLGRFHFNPYAGVNESGYVWIYICSNRSGFTLDAQTGACRPHEDAGGPGDRVTVRVTYNYPLGSSIGADVHPITLQASRGGVVERFRTARNVGLSSNLFAMASELFGAVDSEAPEAFPDTGTEVDGERKVVTNAELRLVVGDPNASLAQAVLFAEQAGGYVADSRLWSEGELQFASVVIRVPAGQSRQVLDQLKQPASRVVNESVTGEDVTEEYVDLEARLASLEATASRIRGFLAAASSVPQALQVNVELGKIEAQIEQTRGRRQYLDNRVGLATIAVYFEPEQPVSIPQPGSWRPLLTVQRSLSFLGNALAFLVDVLIWAIVVGGPFGLAAAATYRLARKLRPK
jgi:hypothetical protein